MALLGGGSELHGSIRGYFRGRPLFSCMDDLRRQLTWLYWTIESSAHRTESKVSVQSCIGAVSGVIILNLGIGLSTNCYKFFLISINLASLLYGPLLVVSI